VGAGPAGPGGSVPGVKPARRPGAHMDAELRGQRGWLKGEAVAATSLHPCERRRATSRCATPDRTKPTSNSNLPARTPHSPTRARPLTSKPVPVAAATPTVYSRQSGIRRGTTRSRRPSRGHVSPSRKARLNVSSSLLGAGGGHADDGSTAARNLTGSMYCRNSTI
jgi:hypothetical protein